MIPHVALLLGLVLAAVVGVRGWLETRRCDRLIWSDPSSLSVDRRLPRFELQLGGVLGAFVTALLIAYLVWPAASACGGHRLAALQAGAAGIASSIALFFLLGRRFSMYLADLAQATLLLGVCSLGAMLAPGGVELAERMPSHLCLVAVACAVTAGLWCWLWGVWEQQLDGGDAWTTAGRLRAQLPRYAFGAASAGVIAIGMMAIWPRLGGMAHRDAGFVRMTTSVGACLLLLLVTLVCGRRMTRGSFVSLAAIVALSLAAFVAVRAADFVTIIRG